ncbi:hypothetical protein [Legionella bononiensis]|uniref:Integral membrane protein n=1 Tax=Legionella bononiensis TaxID=2793102 RepID=A0ABS1WFE5_9GAMM|nr:hypothetical protein [Legionella bononiensis]MBL7481535.1 hypothetical protein [Legionella bononiensis]MBL7528082.1 hypothetical protein [Legionella bononiensis]MBL7562558.1 hypothetical protein [Legionella bononiensis]
MAGPSFFSQLNSTWDEYHSLRNKYSDAIPVPQKSYFSRIRSIDEFATLAVRPIEKPLWLGIHTLSFLLKALLSLAVSIILAPCALALVIIAPTSDLSKATSETFKLAATHTFVSTGMTALALISSVLAVVLNPLYLVTRAASTVVDSLNTTTETCCGLSLTR